MFFFLAAYCLLAFLILCFAFFPAWMFCFHCFKHKNPQNAKAPKKFEEPRWHKIQKNILRLLTVYRLFALGVRSLRSQQRRLLLEFGLFDVVSFLLTPPTLLNTPTGNLSGIGFADTIVFFPSPSWFADFHRRPAMRSTCTRCWLRTFYKLGEPNDLVTWSPDHCLPLFIIATPACLGLWRREEA